MSKLFYGPHEIRTGDDDDIDTVCERIQEAVNSREAVWVEVGAEGHRKRFLVQPGVPVMVVLPAARGERTAAIL